MMEKHSLPMRAGGVIKWRDYYLAVDVHTQFAEARKSLERMIDMLDGPRGGEAFCPRTGAR